MVAGALFFSPPVFESTNSGPIVIGRAAGEIAIMVKSFLCVKERRQ